MRVLETFAKAFPDADVEKARLFFAPGRVNLIGEHTDYNGGYVFPAAITIGTYMVIQLRQDGYFHLKSENFKQDVILHKSSLSYKKEDDWGNYPKGIIAELLKMGVDIPGADIYYFGNIPNGAGLSSSASIGMVTAFGLATMTGNQLDRVELAKMCQRMENTFIGVNTGLMDQFAVGMGIKNHAVFLDTDSLQFEHIPLELQGYKLVITNSNKRRGLADSKYNERRAECEEGLKQLQKHLPALRNLGELSKETFDQYAKHLTDEVIFKRVRHVVYEDDRVLRAVQVLKNGQLDLFGGFMCQSHESLRDDYEVTGTELDTLFEVQQLAPGCIGTRMTGAGFGGCTISIVKEKQVEEFQLYVAPKYREEIGYAPSFYVCEIGDGVREWKGEED